MLKKLLPDCGQAKSWMYVMLIMTVNVCLGVVSDEIIDPVIDLLLNGNPETQSTEVDDEKPIVIGGFWKCGNCTDIDNSKLLYTENNDVDLDAGDESLDIEIGLSLEGMRCVTVAADKPGVVRKLSGNCDGSAVTLHVSPAQHFIVQVYN